jgi:ABC-2 type transport system ATP-binding protein
MSKVRDIISVNNLVKKYDDFTAVNGINFNVSQGEIFGLLGPNGAGKTTTVEILEGLRSPSSGFAEIDGIDVAKNTKAVKKNYRRSTTRMFLFLVYFQCLV